MTCFSAVTLTGNNELWTWIGVHRADFVASSMLLETCTVCHKKIKISPTNKVVSKVLFVTLECSRHLHSSEQCYTEEIHNSVDVDLSGPATVTMSHVCNDLLDTAEPAVQHVP